MISDTVDALSSVENMMASKIYAKDDCKDIFSLGEAATRNFIRNISSHNPLQYCHHMHSIKTIFATMQSMTVNLT